MSSYDWRLIPPSTPKNGGGDEIPGTGSPPPGDGGGAPVAPPSGDDETPVFTDSDLGPFTWTAGEEIAVVSLPEAEGGDGTLTYEISPDLPMGVIFDPKELEISGTPYEAMERTEYVYTVADTDGDKAKITFTITVEEAMAVTEEDGGGGCAVAGAGGGAGSAAFGLFLMTAALFSAVSRRSRVRLQ